MNERRPWRIGDSFRIDPPEEGEATPSTTADTTADGRRRLVAEEYASAMLGMPVEAADFEPEGEEDADLAVFEALGMRERAGAGLSDERATQVLAGGELHLLGRIPSSNAAFLVEVGEGKETVWGIYKPVIGERPLHDYPPGLHRRERAAFVLSEALGFGIVPPTVLRGDDDAPFGEGSVQRFVPGDPRRHYFRLYGSSPETDAQLRRVALFDLVANNADRKAGHVLQDATGRVRGIDQGLCFSAPRALRTVIWDYAGQAIPAADLDVVGDLIDELPSELEELLDRDELGAVRHRARWALASGRLPRDPTGMRVPWPLI